jgi:hypothetical protein
VIRSLAELTGRDLVWRADVGRDTSGSESLLHTLTGYERDPALLQRHCVLSVDEEEVVTAQVIRERKKYFDLIMESADGTFQAHADLLNPVHQSVVWKTGSEQSIAGFAGVSKDWGRLVGTITTATQKRFGFEPSHPRGYDYVVRTEGGETVIAMSASLGRADAAAGKMMLATAMSEDDELPGVVALVFALVNETAFWLTQWNAGL